jgi:putative DNA primase/helicase
MSAKIIIPKCFTPWADEPRWTVWRFEKPNPDKKPTKVPYCPAEPSRHAKSNDPTTWASSHLALQVYERSTGYFNGIMFAQTNFPLVAFDLDDCIINGELHEWARQLIARCGETYCEITPSGNSLRLIGKGDGPCLDKKYAVGDGVSCEIYRKPTGRFITVTGGRYNDAPDTLADLNALADEVLAELEAAKQEAKAKQAKQKSGSGSKKKEMPPLADIIRNGHFELWDNDRSRGEYYVVNELIRLGKTDDDIVAIFSDINNGIAAHCLSKPEKPRDYIMRTITRARSEAGGASADGRPDDDGVEIARLAGLNAVDYERERKAAAERLGVRAAILDRLVTAERDRVLKASGDSDGKAQGRAVELFEPEPWDEAVNGAELLDAIASMIRKYVVLVEHAARFIAVWIIHTYVVDAFQFSPRLCITSPTKGCGKTTLLDVVAAMVHRALSAANISTSGVFRVIEMWRVCLLVDEADSFLAGNEELRGVLNSGHRKGGQVVRVVGDDLEPRAFSTYGAVAIALIGDLPSTLADRSVHVELQRKRPGEKAAPFRLDRIEPLKTLARQAARWAQDHAIEIGATEAELPAEIYNRAADNWAVLKKIAIVAGGNWPDYIDAAARAAVATKGDEELLVQLLTDIKAVEFAYLVRDHDNEGNEIVRETSGDISSAVLVQKLIELQGRPWAELPDTGKAITANKLARMLKPLGIAPDFIGPEDARARGYHRGQFDEAFTRYLSEAGEEGDSNCASVQNPIKSGTSGNSKACSPQDGCTVEKYEKPHELQGSARMHGCKQGNGAFARDGASKVVSDKPWPGLSAKAVQAIATEFASWAAPETGIRDRLAQYGATGEALETDIQKVLRCIQAEARRADDH